MQPPKQPPTRESGEPIAVVGMGCRFPMAPDPPSFWQLMATGTDAIRDVPPGRWNWRDHYDPTPGTEQKTYSRWGGFLDNIDQFDPLFFDISPREARLMDPQQRLMLEVAWEAIEDANYTRSKLARHTTGVFVGCSSGSYLRQIEPMLSSLDYAAAVGNQNAIIANRISYWLGLTGPSLLIDTMCSSSLVAVHTACQSLRAGECELAIAGAVNLLLSPNYYVHMSRMKIHSPTGRCRTFDDGADGIVLGEGAGVVLLKPLWRALQDGDPIHGVIRGTAINHGGETNGLTAPNPVAQGNLIAAALANAGLTAEAVSYVEAHGTGTSLGDPIEIEGLTKAFRRHTDRTEWCAIGSVKTNIGHLEAAAGMAQLIKMLLALRHRQLPPSLNFSQPNRHIRFEKTPFRVNTTLRDWTATGPLVAGLSSFGLGGTNAHVILAEAPAPPPPADVPTLPTLLTLSARTEASLRALAEKYAAWLPTTDPGTLTDIGYATQTGRTPFEHRLALVADTPADMAQQLTNWLADTTAEPVAAPANPPKIAFLCTGQSAQYAGMGRELYEQHPVFADAIGQCDAILQPHLDVPLTDAFFGDEAPALLNRASYAQPLLFAFEYALATLWQSWGIVPDALIGHSLGEYVAACLAGVMTLEDSLTLVAERGRLMEQLPDAGTMVSVFADENTLRTCLRSFENSLCIAVYNGPRHLVVAGSEADVSELMHRLHQQGITAKRLNTTHAFHSPLMHPMLDAYAAATERINYQLPHTRIISNVTGTFADQELTDPAYWVEHVVAPVQFADGLQTLLADEHTVLLEIGPQPVLLSLATRRTGAVGGSGAVHLLPGNRPGPAGRHTVLDNLGRLYRLGYPIDWAAVHMGTSHQPVRMPTYAFDRQSYWVSAEPGTEQPPATAPTHANTHPLLGKRQANDPDVPGRTVWETDLTATSHGFLAGHQFMHTDVVPFSAYVEMSLAAADELYRQHPCQLQEMNLYEALPFGQQAARRVRSVAVPVRPDTLSFSVYSLPVATSPHQDWVQHANVLIHVAA